MTNVTVENFESYSDGSGAEAIVSVYGYRFAVICGSAESVTVSPLNATQYAETARVKGMRKSAAKAAREWFGAKLAELGDSWLAANRLMYQ